MALTVFYSEADIPKKWLDIIKKKFQGVKGELWGTETEVYLIPKTGIVKLLIKLKLGQKVIVLNYKMSSEEEAMLLEMTDEIFCVDLLPCSCEGA